ncbi:MAG: hypothetical protein Q4F58_03335, partial [Candidatus Saccharibacteria bacterium]|nr:hypothetical protein [Candidatus Saccharibacteria bacterium]
ESATTLKDTRDNQEYTVAKLGDGNVWMTKNLAIGCSGNNRSTVTLTASNSNVSTDWSTSTAYSLDANDGTTNCTTSSTSGCDDYDNPRMKCSATYGAWYNYVAATAGTISGSSNSIDATKDVCPAGWRLPSNSEQSSITSYAAGYSPTGGGRYSNGVNTGAGTGYWGSTVSNATERWGLSGNVATNDYLRYRGLYLRCISSS